MTDQENAKAKTGTTKDESAGRRKLVLIGGGSGGVGRAIARVMAADGWDVALTFRTGGDRAKTACDDIRSLGGEAWAHQVDLTDFSAVSAWADSFGVERPIDGVIYAAGPHVTMGYIATLDPAEVKYVYDNDILSCFHLIRASLVHLRSSHGSLLATVTPAIERHMKRDILSASPKAAIEALIRGVAVEEGRFGVRANAVAVGLLEGEGMWQELLKKGDFTPESLAKGISEIPLRRWGDVTDIAAAARFLMSEEASWISGQTLAVDGGYSA